MRRIVLDGPNEAFHFSAGEQRQRAHRTWFRGEHCNFNPGSHDFASPESIKRHVLAGLIPDEPKIGPDTRIMAFGSCFAANISRWLAARQFNIVTNKDGAHKDTYLVRFGEGMVNTFVIRQQFEWALEGKVFEEELWHGYDAQAYGYDEAIRLSTKDAMLASDIFVITLGLSEIWYDEVTGGVFWRAVPTNRYDASRHKFRVSTVAENRDNLAAIVRLIRQVKPSADVIFTLSPIPLVATFRREPCIVANAVSKATLRVAIDEIIRDQETQGLYYWPSYEIITSVFANPWKVDRRHVQSEVLDFIMILFEEAWCWGTRRESLSEAWDLARRTAGVTG
jgi:hypothetical protein